MILNRRRRLREYRELEQKQWKAFKLELEELWISTLEVFTPATNDSSEPTPVATDEHHAT